MAPVLEARTKVQLSKREQRRRYVAKPFNLKKFRKSQKAPKAKWGNLKH